MSAATAARQSADRTCRPHATGTALFVVGESQSQLWLFWSAPLIGAAIAGLSYRFITGAVGTEPELAGR